jgi:D-aminopeptidase
LRIKAKAAALGWRFPCADLGRRAVLLWWLCVFAASGALAGDKPRARLLGIPFDGATGPLNAITDVAGVEVGHTTLISGEGELKPGAGPVRTGVTVILPRGKGTLNDPVFAGGSSLNGNGEMTGMAWVEEGGFLEGPILLTNTHSVGVVRDAAIKWRVTHGAPDATGYWWSLPVTAEIYDGYLNDVNGFHVREEHVFHALESAASGPVAEGSVGGGTGARCFGFKGGIGTASRKLPVVAGGYVVGTLVQANCGLRPQLTIAGAPVGRELTEGAAEKRETGSIIIVLATDAPLLPHQLKRLARRAAMGLARTGSVSGNGSGDLFIAFSTADVSHTPTNGVVNVAMLPNDAMNPLFEAAVQATEEAIINALVAAEPMTGQGNHRADALPHAEVRRLLAKYGRLNP